MRFWAEGGRERRNDSTNFGYWQIEEKGGNKTPVSIWTVGLRCYELYSGFALVWVCPNFLQDLREVACVANYLGRPSLA